jgi:hypothetical protein
LKDTDSFLDLQKHAILVAKPLKSHRSSSKMEIGLAFSAFFFVFSHARDSYQVAVNSMLDLASHKVIRDVGPYQDPGPGTTSGVA